ncbi:hypothetical protein ACFQZ4_11705 [Catellatospora coxensis]
MLTTGGMTGRLDKLETAGLITRTPDPGTGAHCARSSPRPAGN